ncbi:hypothetical protein [Thermofilum pendens]|uniref:Uncharacterized protein n=1 Tax=Thermofilum pendens (strain DSM 2475 / Hrk 5) TaxID=368408 RepID=A1S1F3_THEPD|nr:hypothetical protein [Thermofilum pendens]ABL79283.1 hypothetical protein Tpen_1888 [Thermofilum pendens Hrk 5]
MSADRRPVTRVKWETDADVAAGRDVVAWLNDLSPKVLPMGEYVVLIHDVSDLHSLAILSRLNRRCTFILEFPVDVDPAFAFTVFELLRFNPRIRFRDPSFSYLRGELARLRPGEDTVVTGHLVWRGDFRAILARRNSFYVAPQLGYVASGYFTPDNDPYLYYVSRVQGLKPEVVEVPLQPVEVKPPPPPVPVKPRLPREKPQNFVANPEGGGEEGEPEFEEVDLEELGEEEEGGEKEEGF